MRPILNTVVPYGVRSYLDYKYAVYTPYNKRYYPSPKPSAIREQSGKQRDDPTACASMIRPRPTRPNSYSTAGVGTRQQTPDTRRDRTHARRETQRRCGVDAEWRGSSQSRLQGYARYTFRRTAATHNSSLDCTPLRSVAPVRQQRDVEPPARISWAMAARRRRNSDPRNDNEARTVAVRRALFWSTERTPRHTAWATPTPRHPRCK
jgi:hypothetical protein